MLRRLVCLANSYKHGGRCVAGICIDDGKWLRLRGKADDGALNAAEYTLDNGSEVRLLDLIEVELHYALPSNCHPEDWTLTSMPWRLLERPTGASHWQRIKDGTDPTITILRGSRDRIERKELASARLLHSLMLICPTDLWWWIREERNKRKYRALFRRNYITYDLAVTDPRWLDQLNLLPAGIYPHSTFVKKSSETWLTLSLSEDFHGWHYKLVAGVIVLPKA